MICPFEWKPGHWSAHLGLSPTQGELGSGTWRLSLSLSLTDSVACQPRPGTWRFVLIRPGRYDDDGAPVIACAAVSVMHSVSCARVQNSAHVHEEGAVLQQSA